MPSSCETLEIKKVFLVFLFHSTQLESVALTTELSCTFSIHENFSVFKVPGWERMRKVILRKIDFQAPLSLWILSFQFTVAPLIQVRSQVVYADNGSTATLECEVRICVAKCLSPQFVQLAWDWKITFDGENLNEDSFFDVALVRAACDVEIPVETMMSTNAFEHFSIERTFSTYLS